MIQRLRGLPERAALGAVLGLLAAVLWMVAGSAPLGTDGLIYHLTIPANWLQAGWLSPVELPFHDGAAEHAPVLVETAWWALMKRTGDDRLAWIVHPLLFVATLRLVWLSARALRLGAAGASLATAFVGLFTPFVIAAIVPNNDMALACGAAWALLGLLRSDRDPRAGLVAALGGCALMAASKVVGIVFAAAVIPLLVPVAWRARREGRFRWGELAIAAACAAFVIVSYGRNMVRHGNPLWPAQLLGMPGLYRASALIDHGWNPATLVGLLFSPDSEFALPLPFGLACAAGWIACAIRSVRDRRWGRTAATVVFPALATLLFFAVVPHWRELRLFFPVYVAALLAAASTLSWGLRAVPASRRPAARAAAAAAAPIALVATGLLGEPRVWIAVVAGALALALPRPRLPRRAALALPSAALALLWLAAPLWPAADLKSRETAWRNNYGPQAEAWFSAVREARPGDAVAYVGSAAVFPLFGPGLDRRPVYVPVSTDDRPRALELRAGDHLPTRLAAARRASFEEAFWLDALKRSGARVLVVVRDPAIPIDLPELDVARRRTDLFESVAAFDGAWVFRVR